MKACEYSRSTSMSGVCGNPDEIGDPNLNTTWHRENEIT